MTHIMIDKITKLVNDGKTSKDISNIFGYSIRKIEGIRYRNNIKTPNDIKSKICRLNGSFGNKTQTKQSFNLVKVKNNIDFGYVIGVCIGDGCVMDNKVLLQTVDESFAKSFFDKISKFYGRKPTLNKYILDKKIGDKIYKNKLYYYVTLSSVGFSRTILNIFGSFKTKEWNLNLDKYISYGMGFCQGVVCGLMDSEGSVDKSSITWSSTNIIGSKKFSKLLNHIGLFHTFNIYNRKSCGDYALIRISKRILKDYKSNIFTIKYKIEKLNIMIGE